MSTSELIKQIIELKYGPQTQEVKLQIQKLQQQLIEKQNEKNNENDDSDILDTDDESDCESNNSFSESELQPEDYVYSSEED